MANTSGEKELKRNWPVVSGLEATDKHEGRVSNLVPLKGSFIPRREKVGMQ
tara:strand:+ start:484 stop:636 length:153 start_codon:yes stop_codon:yes gene_type:complete